MSQVFHCFMLGCGGLMAAFIILNDKPFAVLTIAFHASFL